MHDAPQPQAGQRAAELPRLTKRSEFLAAASGRRFHTARMTVQAIPRTSSSSCPALAGPRFGLTVTRKTGGAVERNRIRRRLREALRFASAAWPARDMDFVVIARRDALAAPFPVLIEDLERAMATLDRRKAKPSPAVSAGTSEMSAQADSPSTSTDRP